MPRRGENIYKRRDGRWEGRYIVGRKLDGRAIYRSVYGTSYHSVRQKLAHCQEENRRRLLQGCTMTVKELFARWQAGNSQLKPTSRERYRALIEQHIQPELGLHRVCDLTEDVLNAFVEKKLKSGRLDGKGDLDIQLSFKANQDYVAVKVSKFVELDDKTVFLIATRTKPGFARGLMLDTYDGYGMYQEQSLYKDQFEATTVGGVMTNAWLVIVDKDVPFTVDDALAKLTYTNRRRTDNTNVQLPLPVGRASSTDVNGSGKVDVNDAQLIFDIYNGVYQTFCKTNRTGSTYVEPQIGATMTKFLCADVNKDMKVTLNDAAALVDLIK